MDIITRVGAEKGSDPQMIPPTRVISITGEIRSDGIKFHLLAAPGETDDTIYVWLPHYRMYVAPTTTTPAGPISTQSVATRHRRIDSQPISLKRSYQVISIRLCRGPFANG
ncbi:MAG: hypothetical protein M9934_05015 [Thermomicrobiales bacterium]|nr:hypothetical protein [Thermomicrobiales bacterium]